MHRIMLLMAALTPVAPQTHPTGSTKTKSEATTTMTVPPTVFKNNMQAMTKKPGRNIKGKGSMLMLNYIFDSYASSNRHYHDRYSAPMFEMPPNDTPFEVDTDETVRFDCHISSLRDKLVTWTKVTENVNLELLTVGLVTHTTDPRYKVDIADDNWRLSIFNVTAKDSGTYGCQVSTHPPMLRHFKLIVHPPEIRMIKEVFLETSETLSLKCMVLHLHTGSVRPKLRWYQGNSTVPLDELRGGVFVETDLLNLTTHLQVAGLKIEDDANYTCMLHTPRLMIAVARVHVLRGSSLAELHSGANANTDYTTLVLASILIVFGTYLNMR